MNALHCCPLFVLPKELLSHGNEHALTLLWIKGGMTLSQRAPPEIPWSTKPYQAWMALRYTWGQRTFHVSFSLTLLCAVSHSPVLPSPADEKESLRSREIIQEVAPESASCHPITQGAVGLIFWAPYAQPYLWLSSASAEEYNLITTVHKKIQMMDATPRIFAIEKKPLKLNASLEKY